MFLAVPVNVESRTRSGPVWANSLVIAINVLVYVFGLSGGWAVGRGSSVLNVLLYGFAHAHLAHLLGNCWVLLVFGHAVNRRIGNGHYLACYLGTVVVVGLTGWCLLNGLLVGASGGVFAILAIAALLCPGDRMSIGYVALLPITILIGLFRPPRAWLDWVVSWGRFEVYVFWCLLLVPMLEVWGLASGWAVLGYWNWTNLAHLVGFVCGVCCVLAMPERITMHRPATAT